MSSAETIASRAERVQVLQLVGCVYHSGLDSRGYRLQCRCRRWLLRHGHGLLHAQCYGTPWQQGYYEQLARRYAAKL